MTDHLPKEPQDEPLPDKPQPNTGSPPKTETEAQSPQDLPSDQQPFEQSADAPPHETPRASLEHALLDHRDLEIRLDASLATKLLAALEFPLRIEFPEDELEQETLEVSEAHTPEAADDIHDDGIEAIVEDVLIQPLADHLEKAYADTPKPTKAAEKRYQVIVRALTVILPTPPDMRLGNPVELRNVALQVHAELKVGIRLLGKWRWKNTSANLEFQGRKAKLLLEAQQSRLLVLPELEDTDVVMKLSIWKWQLKCKFGVSKWINRQLAKRGPFKVLDFADVHGGVQILGKNPEITIHSIVDGRNYLQIKADIGWQ